MRIALSRTEGRLALVGLAVFGVVHLLVPRFLLRAARSAYGLALDVDFAPRDSAPWRVRLVGFGSLLAWAIGRRRFDRTTGPIEFSTTVSEPVSAEHSADDH